MCMPSGTLFVSFTIQTFMQGGGHIRGYAVEGEAAKQVTEAFAAKQNSCGGFCLQ